MLSMICVDEAGSCTAETAINAIDSVRELYEFEGEALREYHRIAGLCKARIEAIRKERGTKIKDYRNDPNWANMDAGRNAPLNHNGAEFRL